MAVTENQITPMADDCRGSYPVAASTHLYQKTLAFVNASGYLTGTTNSGANRFSGVTVGESDNSGGANGDRVAEVYREGVFRLPGSGFSQADCGKDAFAVDNYTVSTTASGNSRIGTIVEVSDASTVWVMIDCEHPAKQSALTAQLTTITHTAPGTPDYAIQDLASGGYGFANKDEGNTVLKVVANLQARLATMETSLKNVGLLA